MKRRTILASFLLLGAGALVVALGVYYKQTKSFSAEEQRERTILHAGGTENHNSHTERSVALPSVQPHGELNYATVFSESHNYLDLARSLIKSARSGNLDAEYFLGKALRSCNESRPLFHFNSQVIGLDDAILHYASGQNAQRKIRALYERCHDLEAVGDQSQQFGNPNDWIKAASDQGQPVAQSDEALTNFLAIQKSAMGLGDFKASTASGDDPRSLLMAAVQTKDPDVLFNIGQAQGYLNHFNGDSTKNELAWWLVACERGLPCDSNSEFQINVAQNDSLLETLSGADLICTMAGKDCQEVEQRAQEINEMLDAEQWDQLGF